MGQVNITVTQDSPDVDGTAFFGQFSDFDACAGGSGSYGTCTATGGFSPSASSVTCGQTVGTTASGTRTFTYTTNSGTQSRFRTCIEGDAPLGNGNPGTCTGLDGTIYAIDEQEEDTKACTQASFPGSCTATGSVVGTKPMNGSASQGAAENVGDQTGGAISYEHGSFGAWSPDPSTEDVGTIFEQVRTRPTFESKTAVFQPQAADCNLVSSPGCGGSAGTCSGHPIGQLTVPLPDKLITAATDGVSVTPTGSGSPSMGGNGGRETRNVEGTNVSVPIGSLSVTVDTGGVDPSGGCGETGLNGCSFTVTGSGAANQWFNGTSTTQSTAGDDVSGFASSLPFSGCIIAPFFGTGVFYIYPVSNGIVCSGTGVIVNPPTGTPAICQGPGTFTVQT